MYGKSASRRFTAILGALFLALAAPLVATDPWASWPAGKPVGDIPAPAPVSPVANTLPKTGSAT